MEGGREVGGRDRSGSVVSSLEQPLLKKDRVIHVHKNIYASEK